MSDPETLSVYAAKAGEYAELTRAEAEHPTLQRFIQGVTPGGRVLDLGCGPGAAAGAMAAAGLQAEAWDPVPEMVALAAARPGVAARQAGFGDLTGADVYDGIWANFSMLHTPLADWPDQHRRIATALRPGGMFHIGTKLGTGEARDSIGRLYSYVTEDTLLGLITDAGLTPDYTTHGREKGLDGVYADWIVVQAHA
ncbi:MAG: class I SAM-dependent methyltransferase [Pseudomonadota bacterium]